MIKVIVDNRVAEAGIHNDGGEQEFIGRPGKMSKALKMFMFGNKPQQVFYTIHPERHPGGPAVAIQIIRKREPAGR